MGTGRSWLERPLPLVVVIGLTVVYLGVHLLTLARSPMPWFDDTFFASITDSVVRNGELKLLVSPLWFDKPVYVYGPAYFGLTGLIMRVAPFDILAFRLPSLVFGLVVVVAIGLILRARRVPASIALWTAALLALDPTFYKSSHSGRMDTMSLGFVLLSLLTIPAPERSSGGASVRRALLSGVFAGLSLLTTPRPAYLLIVIGCLLIYRIVRERSPARATELLVWGATAGVLYSAWALYAFQTPWNLIDYYRNVPGEYVGGRAVRLVHVPLLLGLVVLGVAAGRRAFANDVMIFVSAGIVGFYLIVREPNLFYSIFMVPLAYLGIGYLAAQLLGSERRSLSVLVFMSLLVLNLSGYLARNAFVFARWADADYHRVDRAVDTWIPKGARVVGDDKYFYAVRKRGAEFQYFGRGGTDDERVAYHRDVYAADCLMTERGDDSPLVQAYVRDLHLNKVGSIASDPPSPAVQRILDLGAAFLFTPGLGYGGTIWCRSPAER
jgi:hypothetical protein